MHKSALFPMVLVGTMALLTSSCQTASVDLTSNRTGWSDYAKFAVKDFNVVGVVRVTSTETTTHSPLNLSTEDKGSKITYDMLMSDAKKVGADDIINVRIDQQQTAVRTVLDFFTGYTDTKVYTGNALAIKYKDAAPRSEHPTQGGDDPGVIQDKDSSTLGSALSGILGTK